PISASIHPLEVIHKFEIHARIVPPPRTPPGLLHGGGAGWGLLQDSGTKKEFR
ncbi:hypothetical protein LCGC14_1878650, partial [marine sediment metagenome]